MKIQRVTKQQYYCKAYEHPNNCPVSIDLTLGYVFRLALARP